MKEILQYSHSKLCKLFFFINFCIYYIIFIYILYISYIIPFIINYRVSVPGRIVEKCRIVDFYYYNARNV